jgi:hypothetical protein
MSEVLGVSAVVILAGLLIASWFTNSKILKLATLGFVFLYPAMIGQVTFPSGPDQLSDYISGILKYWLAQVWQQIWNYIQQQFNPFGG